MVLAGAAETFLSSSISPQALHGGEELGGVRLRVLHAADHVTHQLGIRLDRFITGAQGKGGNRRSAAFYSTVGVSSTTEHLQRSFLSKTKNHFETPQSSRIQPAGDAATLPFGTKHSKKNKSETCFSILVSELDAQRIHGSEDGRQALDGVAVHHRLILLHVVPGETVLVNNPARPHRQ